MKRRHAVRTTITSVVFMFLFGLLAPGTAHAACGGCFCPKAGAANEGGYACVSVMGYNRWMPLVNPN
jgi:hypothetical protein